MEGGMKIRYVGHPWVFAKRNSTGQAQKTMIFFNIESINTN